jgi:signal transduction histidine kinase/ActR/RegA family two-component response regulator
MNARLQSSESNTALNAAPEDAARRLRRALETAGIGVWEFDPATGELVWDARVREVVEADPDVTPTWAEHFLPAIHPDDLNAVQSAFAATLEGGAPVAIDFRVVGARTGRVTWAHLTGAIETSPSGPRLIGTARDITAERARYAETLAERRIWADIVEAHDDPIAALDLDLVYTAVNRAYVATCEAIFGKRFAVGQTMSLGLEHMPAAGDAASTLWRHALSGQSFELRTGNPDVGDRVFDTQYRPLRDASGAVVGAYQTSREVTAQVEAERSLAEAARTLQRAQKMESIGALTGGIAHDFNNLLQVVSGNLQLLAKDVAHDPKAARRVDNALMGIDRGAKLTAQLLAFGRRQALDPRVINVGRLMEGMDDLLRRALGEETEMRTVVEAGLWNTFVDPAQVENALLNLAINARDAMAGRGKLTIEAVNASLDETYVRSRSEVRPGDYVMIAVTDTGSGMAPELIERVFEPFFSTKPEGQGTGLGLSMVHGFVKQSAGHIEIYSEVGHGTTVKLYLPKAEAEEHAPGDSPRARATRGDARILLVEDDEQVRETAVALLEDLGYAVVSAADATVAMAIVESGAAIDLIFTDIVMPGELRSVEMVERARERLPGVAVLFTSGYTRNAVVHGGRLDAGVELLMKPYTRESLGAKVADVLRQALNPAGPSDRNPPLGRPS